MSDVDLETGQVSPTPLESASELEAVLVHDRVVANGRPNSWITEVAPGTLLVEEAQ